MTSTLQDSPRPSKLLNISLWVVQILLALMFGMAGMMKSTTPLADMAAQGLDWVLLVPEAAVRFIGISELAAAFGMILPAATRIKPLLTPLAGACLVVVMIFALLLHVVRGEWSSLPINLVLGGMAGFVAWGRYKAAPIAPR